MLTSLNLPGEAGEHLAARAALLDGTYREVAGRVPANSHDPAAGSFHSKQGIDWGLRADLRTRGSAHDDDLHAVD
ncbi:protein of unknown function [Streptomyces murinus]